MSQTATASLGEREALSEIFLLFSALFDGPPPTQIVPKLLTETFPELSKAVGLTPLREAIDPADFATEYEPLFLIPDATNPLSLYSNHYATSEKSGGKDLAAELVVLAAALQIPWRKTEFVPGRAYPVTPDHLSVEFALLSVLVLRNPDTEIAGKSVFIWADRMAREATQTLEKLHQILQALPRRYPAYDTVIALALAFMQTYVQVEFSTSP
ncbi:MAG: molecular chaperone TorD family protein [Gammaproteobacteria bacterium]|nr:molecular chaperone TorD family protein [Gammaproteobacteria bacterium]